MGRCLAAASARSVQHHQVWEITATIDRELIAKISQIAPQTIIASLGARHRVAPGLQRARTQVCPRYYAQF
jgi:hypothetical protein